MINLKKNNYLSALMVTLIVFSGLLAVNGCTEQDGNADKTMAGDTNGNVMASGSQRDPAGPYRVKVDVNPEKPKVGINQVKIIVEDTQGNTISGADLKAVAVMSSMGSMPAMYAPAEMQETSPGVYQGEFEPAMSGEWPLTIDIATNSMGQGSITYDLATGRKGLRCANCIGDENPAEGSFVVDNYRRQLIGVTTSKAERQDLVKEIRAVGRITYDETRLVDITLKFNGWVGELYANYTGIPISKGDPLFTVYSPELLAAQEEYLETFRRNNNARSTRMLKVARRKLLLLDLSEKQITALEKNGKASEYITIYSPASGVVVTKLIVEGSAIKSGEKLFRIADVSKVWAEAQIYDYEIPLVRTGMPASVILPELQDREFAGQISHINPYMQSDTRTATVRLELDNTDGFLRPDMYAHIHLKAVLANRLVVPESAVMYAGQTRVVFVDMGEGRLQPRRIKIGARNQQYIEVLEGLESGDVVVTSGNFLIASEAKLKTGVDQW